MARPPTAIVIPNRCRRERPECGDMVYPLSDKRWRDTTRRRAPLGLPVLLAEADQASLEAAASTWCGRSIAPFARGAKQPQTRRCAGATHPASLCSMVPRTAPTHATAGRDMLHPRALRVCSTQGALGGAEGRPFLYGFVGTLAAQPRVRQVQVSPPYDGPSCGMLFSPIRLVSHADPQEDACLRRSHNRRRT